MRGDRVMERWSEFENVKMWITVNLALCTRYYALSTVHPPDSYRDQALCTLQVIVKALQDQIFVRVLIHNSFPD